MTQRRPLLSATLLAAAASWIRAGTAAAATEQPFTPERLAEAQRRGAPILIHVNAPWCPTCARQRPVIESTIADPRYADLVVLKVDFDSQKDALRALNVRQQSTLIAFNGAQERARSAGETNADAIRALIARTL